MASQSQSTKQAHYTGAAASGMQEQSLVQRVSGFVQAPERVFLLLGLLFGLISIFAMPPFQIADEPAHFYRVYQLSTGQLAAQKLDGQTGGMLPASLIQTVDTLYGDIAYNQERKQSFANIAATLAIPLEPDALAFADFRNTSLFSPAPYLSQIVGVALGRVLGAPPIVLLYLGRLSSLLVTVTLLFVAIKTTPVFKWVFVLLALTPSVLIVRSSFSADGFTNSIALLLVAVVLRYAFAPDHLIGRRQLVMMIGLSVLLSLSKQAYFVLPLIYLLIPISRVGNRVRYFGFLAVILLACMLALAGWAQIARNVYTPLRAGETALYDRSSTLRDKDLSDIQFNPQAQARVIVSDPARYMLVIAKHVIDKTPSHIKFGVGAIGWDVRLSLHFAMLYVLALLYVMLADNRYAVRLSFWNKALLFGIAFGNFVLILTIGYLLWNDVGAREIHGVGGRYFIPLAPLFALMFYNRRLRLSERFIPAGAVVAIYSVCSLLYAFVVVVERYYGWKN
jgi:uncharacterized membrane protein